MIRGVSYKSCNLLLSSFVPYKFECHMRATFNVKCGDHNRSVGHKLCIIDPITEKVNIFNAGTFIIVVVIIIIIIIIVVVVVVVIASRIILFTVRSFPAPSVGLHS